MGHGLATGHNEVSPSSSEEVADIPLAHALLCSLLPRIDEQSHFAELPAFNERTGLAYSKEDWGESWYLLVE